MALVYFLVLVVFCLISWWAIRWFLNRYFSSKPWHRWVRYAVWLGCIVLLTFDSIYYQVVVVHGMCEADQKRVYPIPPASLVVAGPYSNEDVRIANKNKSVEGVYWWPCAKSSTYQEGRCLLANVVFQETENRLKFGAIYREEVLKNTLNGDIYLQIRFYRPAGQWLTRKLFGFGFIWTKQSEKCGDGFWNEERPIILD